MSDALPLLPTSVVGSHALPGWFHWAQEGIKQDKFGRLDLRELYNDAVDLAILDQERAGVDVIWDGEMRRYNFIMGFYRHMTGFQMGEVPRKLGPYFYDANALQDIVSKITAPNGLGVVEEFNYARQRTTKRLKAPLPGALTLLTPTVLKSGYKNKESVVADLVTILNQECRDLVAAGCDFIQIDEPAFDSWFHQAPRQVVDIFNKTVEGVSVKIAIHICFGNQAGRARDPRSYAPFLKYMRDLKAEQFVLEFANREMSELDLWRDTLPERELAAGVIDVKNFHRETPDEVAAKIRQVLKFVQAEKLWIVPDCGFNQSPRWYAVAKLNAMVAGTRIVRAELGT
jgi:5-methyltetrahydropteroyltriglutamate--homocysteine methyltransferase